jgi:hypothetical protein
VDEEVDDAIADDQEVRQVNRGRCNPQPNAPTNRVLVLSDPPILPFPRRHGYRTDGLIDCDRRPLNAHMGQNDVIGAQGTFFFFSFDH